MELKINKNTIAIFLFYFCLGLAILQVFHIRNNFKLELEEQYNPATNYKIRLDKTQPQLTYSQYSIWSVVNLVFYLFVGGLIYGKIEWVRD